MNFPHLEDLKLHDIYVSSLLKDSVSVSLRASAGAAGATPSSSSAPSAWGVAGTAVAVSALGLAMRSSRGAKAGSDSQDIRCT